MVEFAPCKINLGLQILRRRPDGYHDVATAMVQVPWTDIVEAVPADTDSLTVTGNAVDCPPEKNLVMKAVAAMRRQYNFGGVEMHLHKIVPDGAGLGGGSSDAAAAVRAVNAVYNLGLSPDAMAAILATVGSDCPFFAFSQPMLATGTGTTLSPIDINLSGYHIIIAKPADCSVSTAQAYAGVKASDNRPDLATLLQAPVPEWRSTVFNDFEPSVFALCPAIAAVKQRMYDAGAVYAAMSGSGAAVFGLFTQPVSPTLFSDCTTFAAQL